MVGGLKEVVNKQGEREQVTTVAGQASDGQQQQGECQRQYQEDSSPRREQATRKASAQNARGRACEKCKQKTGLNRKN